MADSDASSSILAFLSSPCFTIPVPSSIDELSDGVSLFLIMSTISPDHFLENTLTIAPGDNWPLKLANLKKLKNNLTDYYHTTLSKSVPSLDQLDLTKISKNEATIAHLFEYVLGALISCPAKATYIQAIMSLDAADQTALKTLTQRAMGHLQPLESEGGRRSDVSDEEIEFEGGNDLALNR